MSFTDNFYTGLVVDDGIDVITLDLLDHLPKTFEIWRVKEMLQMKLSPAGVVLLQELQRYNALVDEIEKTLQLLRKVCHLARDNFCIAQLICTNLTHSNRQWLERYQ